MGVGRPRLSELLPPLAAAAVLTYAGRGSGYALAAAVAAAALPLAGLYWLGVLAAAAASLTLLAQTGNPQALTALLASAAAALASPGPARPQALKPRPSIVAALAAAGLASLQAALAYRALSSVEPYSFMVAGSAGVAGVLYAAAGLAAAVVAYRVEAPPSLRPRRHPLPPGAPLELLVYAASLAPAVEHKVVVAAFIAGVAAAGAANLSGREKLRLPAFTAAYIAALVLLGAWRLVGEFYVHHNL